jgi:beta-glucosidase
MRAYSVSTAVLSAIYLVIIPALAQNITSDIYFYGQSPYVAPVPLPNGSTHSWATAYAKAVKLVAQLTQDEKANLNIGQANLSGCMGYIAPIARVGFPGLCLHDGTSGVRFADGVNAWPSGVHMGATWVAQSLQEHRY